MFPALQRYYPADDEVVRAIRRYLLEYSGA
jgi:hypothetical protein